MVNIICLIGFIISNSMKTGIDLGCYIGRLPTGTVLKGQCASAVPRMRACEMGQG